MGPFSAPIRVPFPCRFPDKVVKVVDFDHESELERFVQLAALLDDGEAACVAVASTRGLSLATDDRKAIAIANDLSIEVLTTPEILMSWIDALSPKPKEIAETIYNIERYGRFKPHHTSPHTKWWIDNGPCSQEST